MREKSVDILVNNAGYGSYGTIEFLPWLEKSGLRLAAGIMPANLQ